MSARNGINVSSVPFEQRSQPPYSRRRRRERLTAVDRLVCFVCGAFLGGVLWTFGYLTLHAAAMKAAARQAPAVKGPVDPMDRLPSFWWGSSVALGFALFGAVVGAERMMDGFAMALRLEGEAARAVNRS